MMVNTPALFGLFALTTLLPSTAFAHGSDEHDVDLHVGYAHDSCYFDLHPELTEAQFERFGTEAGSIARFKQVAAADTLGQWNFDFGVGYTHTPIDDTKGAWNNTMTHPGEDHYLGNAVAAPLLELRMGIFDRVDLEAYGSVNWLSNYGFFGVATKVGILRQEDGAPVSLAIRPSVAGVVGPSEVQVWNLSTDLSVSRRFWGLAPFAGVGVNSNIALDRSNDTEVGHQASVLPAAFVGADYRWRMLSVGVQAELSALVGYNAHLGLQF